MAGTVAPRTLAPSTMPPRDIAASICGLIDLNLSHNGLSAECAPAIARGLLNRPDLTTVRLQRNLLGDAGAEAIAMSLREGCGVTELNLSENRISDEGAMCLGEAIRVGCKLRALELTHNEVANDGGTSLAKGVMSKRTPLHTLRLAWNKLGDPTGIAFGHALRALPPLRALYVQHNNFADRASESLVVGVESNAELAVVATDGNALPYAATLKLREALERNKRRARDGAGEKAEARRAELRHAAVTLENKEQEFVDLCRQREAGERRHRLLVSEFEDARQAHLEMKNEALREKHADAERVAAAERSKNLKKSELDDSRVRWHASLQSVRGRIQQEELKVKQLSDACGPELREMRKEEEEVRASIASMEARIAEALARAVEREDYAERMLSQLNREKEKVELRPQLRKMLAPPPPEWTDDDIYLIDIPDARVDDMARRPSQHLTPSPETIRPRSVRSPE
jgi:Ran GTPase-activating protein (RanGAP) involved in mRNA processing and transport